LLEHLDVMSKAASLAEAQAATTQGRAVMLFTIITVIFVSFVAALIPVICT
jgi:hypothetical protein